MTDIPKLLKARREHSRIFAVAIFLMLLVSQPQTPTDDGWRLSVRWLGYFLVVIGAMGRVYCSAYIGGRKNDVVVRQGPFSIVRNPLYVFSFIATVGVALQSGMMTLLVMLVIAFVLYYPAVVAKEEAFLKHKFGADYERYMSEVPRWWPKFSQWNEPEQVDAKPKFLRRTMLDALVFFLPMPGFAVLTVLHANGTLPVWLTLP